jgi:hypothetical protein
MTKSTIVCLALLCIAGVTAAQLSFRNAGGLMSGVVLGSAVSMLGAGWVRHSFMHRPKRAINAVLETFLFKMAFVMLGALSFRYIEAAAQRADWKVFLLAFVATAFIIQTVSIFENVRLLRGSSKGPETTSAIPGEPALVSTQAE